jgi:hypothetical protein
MSKVVKYYNRMRLFVVALANGEKFLPMRRLKVLQ